MAAEVTLKEESALEIGKQLAVSFQGLQAVGADTAMGSLELDEEREQTSYLEKISGGIKKMVVFFGGIAASIKEANRDRLITEAQGTETEKEALADDPDRSLNIGDMLKGLGEKTKAFGGKITGIFGGLFGKAALFGLLLAFSLNLDKFGKDLGPVVKKIFNGLKAAFTSLKRDIFPIITNIIKFFGDAFTGVQNILKGLFEGDGSAFLSGMKTILFDLPIRLVSIIGDAFFSLVDAVLSFFGIDSQFVKDIKIAFRTLPEAIDKAINNFVSFFTETIPNFFKNIKQNVKDYFKEVTEKAAEIQQKVFDFIMAPFKGKTKKVKSFFGFSTDTATDGDPEEVAKSNAITNNTSKSEALMAQRSVLLAQGPEDDSASAQNSFKFKVKKLNAAIIREEGRDNDHRKVNMTSPIDYAMADTEGKIDSFVQEKLNPTITSEVDNLPNIYNTPVIEPNEFMNNGGQLNKDSQEFASANNTTNFNVVKGGDTSSIQSNQTYTNISENTTTSDTNAKKIFKTA